MNLWTFMFHEKPAGSIENNDALLAEAAMCNPDRWPQVRSKIMRHFILCSDGRWYHRFLCEQVIKPAWDKRQVYASRGKAGASKRWADSGGHGSSIARERKGRGRGKDSSASGGASPEAVLFDLGLETLAGVLQRTEEGSRGFLGKLCSITGKNYSFVLNLIARAVKGLQDGDAELEQDAAAWLLREAYAYAHREGLSHPPRHGHVPRAKPRTNEATERILGYLDMATAEASLPLFPDNDEAFE
jgi:hypothetical protein